jgi:hypothetical protein
MRRVNADLNRNAPASQIVALEQLAEAFERGEVSPDQLPPKLLRQLSNYLNQLPGFDDNR